MEKLIRVKSVRALEKRKVLLEFTDGVQRELDLEPYLWGPVFEPILKDDKVFRSVHVDHEIGTIVWENGADMDPYVLYGKYKPAWMEKGAMSK